MPDEIRIFSGNSNRPLANKIASYIHQPISACVVTRFSDNEIFVKIDENIRGMDVFIIQSTNTPSDNLLELLIMIDAARRASARRITAVIPYFGYARADRKDQPRVSIVSKLIANMITTSGADRVILMDLHASQIQGFFDVPSDHLYSARIFNRHFLKAGLDNVVVVCPDVGSIKIARAFATKLNTTLAIIDKRRPQPNQSEVMNIIGDVKNKNVIIRDDMVDTAGTLIKAAEALAQNGAKSIIACCTHGVLSDDAIEKLVKSPITKIYITDTLDQKSKNLPDKFVILSVAELLGEAILRIHAERSVSTLFD
ncbi:MAG: ribose-phosphate pyrophosphokinase [candidate division Zixibacteria bacterium 4484_95]|nr:MAG: ribose-phosphate pyrophosphokinase [candidate division Zixibacteria bacterium 4484_95]